MNRVMQAVEQIASLPYAQVDVSYAQGKDVLEKTHRLRVSHLGLYLADSFDAYQVSEQIMHDVDEIKDLVSPHLLPDEYLYFLSYYGGLSITRTGYQFSIRGVGPMQNMWYYPVIGTQDYFDEGLYENGFLLIGALVVQAVNARLFHLLLDLGDSMQKGSVICIKDYGSVERGLPDLRPVLQDPHNAQAYVERIADSFGAFLERAAETQGALGLLPEKA